MKEYKTIEDLYDLLKTRAYVKQKTFRNVKNAFEIFKSESKKIVNDLKKKIMKVDESVVVEYMDVGDFEFHVKFSGDLLIFLMHTNIITFDRDYHLLKNDYVQEEEHRKYFGHIMIYNFMADSVKYNRLDDPGYLIARFLINSDNHFFIEGIKPLAFIFPEISGNIVSAPILKHFIEKAMVAAIEHDLVAPAYPQLRTISLYEKINQHIGLGRGQKIGFQISGEDLPSDDSGK